MIDLTELSPAPWIPNIDDDLPSAYSEPMPPGSNLLFTMACSGVLSGNVKWNQTDLETICLLRSDLDVKMRRGWHTERCEDTDRWVVPQLRRMAAAWDRELNWELASQAREVMLQTGHDIGLLTRAWEWYEKNVKENQ